MTSLDKLPIALETQPKSSAFQSLFKNNTSSIEDAVKFDWENKWLKGEEYSHILNNIDLYCKVFNLSKLGTKTHPPSIYTEPQNGMVYFVEGNSVGSDFGFPRVDTKKHYRWKKMNFTTDLPKKRPYVTYIVASAVKCERFFPNSKDEGPSYRMHAVILNKERVHTQKYKSKATGKAQHNDSDENSQSLSSTCSSAESTEHEKGDSNLEDFPGEMKRSASIGDKNYILCHIRKIDSNYKTSRAGGKKGSFSKEDEENEEEEEEDEEEVEEPLTKKLFNAAESAIPVQERAKSSPVLLNTNKETPPKVQSAFKLVSTDLLSQLNNSRSEAGSPLEITRSTLVSSPGLQPKSGLFGLGSRNSAFQAPNLAARLSPSQEANRSPKSEEEEISVISEPKTPIRQTKPIYQKPLFEKFNVGNAVNFDYLQFFASLLHLSKK